MNQENNSRKKSKFVPILIILLLIVAILMIISSLGFGGGFGLGGNNSGNSVASVSNSTSNSEQEVSSPETNVTSEESSTSIRYIDITVSGDTYKLNDVEKSLDAIISIIKEYNKTVVRITDDNAVADAMDNLISALEDNHVFHMEMTE